MTIVSQKLEIHSIAHCAAFLDKIESKEKTHCDFTKLECTMATNFYGPCILTHLLSGYLSDQYLKDNQEIKIIFLMSKLINPTYLSPMAKCTFIFSPIKNLCHIF